MPLATAEMEQGAFKPLLVGENNRGGVKADLSFTNIVNTPNPLKLRFIALTTNAKTIKPSPMAIPPYIPKAQTHPGTSTQQSISLELQNQSWIAVCLRNSNLSLRYLPLMDQG